jgi:N-acetylglucosamine kinase-like BadF-type ATPase
VCGTGSAIGARRGNAIWHASFWGEDGGAGTLGRAALRALVRSDLGIDPPVGFTRDALDVIGVPTVEALLHRATRRGAPRTLLAQLAPMLLDAADAGDQVARDIVIGSGRVLGEYARVAVGRVGLAGGTYPLVLAGGVFLHASPLLREEIAAALPEATLVESEFEPVVGALLLGFDGLDRPLDVDALRLSLPHAERFRTLVGGAPIPIATNG